MAANARRLLRLGHFDGVRELERCEKLGVDVLLPSDAAYPARLFDLKRPPEVLYVRGRFQPGQVCAAVVGPRSCSAYGLRAAGVFSAALSRAGVCVLSGLARGVDSCAHRTALETRGTTWAVLGSGLACVYPEENAGLADRIAESGGVVMTELPLDAEGLSHHFPMRNRIVAALAELVVVAEAGRRSGALITAKEAAELGRAVFAVPGPFDSWRSWGCHDLLKGGALFAHEPEDVLAAISAPFKRSLYSEPRPALPALSPEESKILQCLGSEGLTLEEAAQSSGLDFPRLSSIIFQLELKRLIHRLPGQRYAQKGR